MRRPRDLCPQVVEYREWLLGLGMSPGTIHQRVSFADWRLCEWGTLDQEPAFLAGWLSAFDGWTRRTYQAHLRALYRWLVETEQLARDPMARIRSKPAPRPRPKPLTPDELERVLDAATGRLRAWLLLGLRAGLRSHEIAKVRGEDVTETGIRVLGKGGRVATIPTHPELWALAQSYPRHGYWFPSPMRGYDHIGAALVTFRVAEHFRELGIAEGSVHRCRHTFGTTLGRAGVNVRVVQELMRHASLETTAMYLGVDEDEKAAAIGLLG